MTLYWKEMIYCVEIVCIYGFDLPRDSEKSDSMKTFKKTLMIVWASLIAQLVKNLPAMQEIPFLFLGWEDTLEKGKATHSSILAWRFHGLYSPWHCKESDTTEPFYLLINHLVLKCILNIYIYIHLKYLLNMNICLKGYFILDNIW